MKKINIMLAALALVGLASCDDDNTYGIAQTNPQQGIVNANGVVVVMAPEVTSGALNLATANAEIPVIRVDETQITDDALLPAGTELTYKVMLANNAAMQGATELNNVHGNVSALQWVEIFQSYFNLNPTPQDMWLGVEVYANNFNATSGLTQSVRLGGENFYYGLNKILVTPIDMALEIEAGYYFLAQGAAPADGVAMSHSPAHQYDDPNFNYTFEVSAAEASAGYTWMIAPASVHDGAGTTADCYGPSGTGADDAMQGTLAKDGVKGVIRAPGKYTIIADMLDLKYEISQVVEYLWMPGSANGWNNNDGIVMGLFEGNLVGFLDLGDEFKFTGIAGSWDLNWGLGDQPGDGLSGTLAPGGANIKAPAEGTGLYYGVVNIPNKTFNFTKINAVGLIGNFNGWGGDVALTQDANDPYIWSGEFDADGGEWKIRMNGDWAVNLGGDPNALTPNGGNLGTNVTPAAGKYNVTVNLKYPRTVTATAL